jgi:hypothetical protein
LNPAVRDVPPYYVSGDQPGTLTLYALRCDTCLDVEVLDPCGNLVTDFTNIPVRLREAGGCIQTGRNQEGKHAFQFLSLQPGYCRIIVGKEEFPMTLKTGVNRHTVQIGKGEEEHSLSFSAVEADGSPSTVVQATIRHIASGNVVAEGVKPGQKIYVDTPGAYAIVLQRGTEIVESATVTVNSHRHHHFLVTKSPMAPGFGGGGGGQVQEAFTDLAAYPILTEDITYGGPSAPSTGAVIPGQAPLGQIAAKAVADVLGWKGKPEDSKGFVAALTQSFTLTDVEGHTQSKWTPRTYAVQTDLAGGITGAQASIYTRAKDFLDKSLPILDGLYALDEDADPGDIDAMREVLRSQMTELVNELGILGGPRVARVNQYFFLLLGVPAPVTPATVVIVDPDQVHGTLGQFRQLLGLTSTANFVNTVDDEQDMTNFRLLADYLTSLAQSWISNFSFFLRTPSGTSTPFFGTQLVLLSRQLSAIGELVDDIRFAMDSVFLGPSERQTLLLNFGSPAFQPLFVEELLSWVQRFATEEGPGLIEKSGKLGVGNGFVPAVGTLQNIVARAVNPPRGINSLPPGYYTPRVRRAWQDLATQLTELFNLAVPVGRNLPPETP